MKFKKGQRVRVKAHVESGYYEFSQMDLEFVEGSKDPDVRALVRFTDEFWGIVTGYSHRHTGKRTHDDFRDTNYLYESPGYLVNEKRHQVVMVQPIHTNRYLKPCACLESDLEIIENER